MRMQNNKYKQNIQLNKTSIITDCQYRLYKLFSNSSCTQVKLMNINTLADFLIRPMKFTYSLNDLGPCFFQYKNKIYERIDFYVVQAGNKIQTSIWRQKGKSISIRKRLPVLIYLHCNCGCRVESLQLLYFALDMGFTFVSFDSRACGHSDGDYISLDLEEIINHIHENYVNDPQIILWGRSMGAVTALHYLTEKSKFLGNVMTAVLDSPFINLTQVICQLVSKKTGAPKVIVSALIGYLQPLVEERAKFKISEFDLRKSIKKIKCPLILMASKSDQLVPFQHLEQIYEAHCGRKSIFYMTQSHTDQRSGELILKIFRAINRYFLYEVNKSDKLEVQSVRFSQESSKMSENKNTSKKGSKKKIEIVSADPTKKVNSFQSGFGFTQGKSQSSSSKTSNQKKKLSLNHHQNTNQYKTDKNRIKINLYNSQNKNWEDNKSWKERGGIHKQKVSDFCVFNESQKGLEEGNSRKQNFLRNRLSEAQNRMRIQKIVTLKTMNQ